MQTIHKIKNLKRQRRHRKLRNKINGTADCPRLCVYRSLKHIYAQIIDDQANMTLVSTSDKELKNIKEIKSEDNKKINPKAYLVGELIAKKALDKKIQEVVFDRGGYKYHGRVESLALGARSAGLKF